jgi:hypothetical protein
MQESLEVRFGGESEGGRRLPYRYQPHSTHAETEHSAKYPRAINPGDFILTTALSSED